MRYLFAILLFVLFIPFCGRGQKGTKYILTVLFNLIYFFSFSQGEYVVEIDRTNGNYKKIDCAIPGILWIIPNVRAYNETNGIFMFQGDNGGPDHLYSINVTDGSVISHPLLTDDEGFDFVFDNSTGTLYGLSDTLSQFLLETINPTTGAHVNISTNPIPNNGFCQGDYTFDEINHKYITITFNNILSINAATGIVSLNKTLGLLSGEAIVCASLSCDNTTGIIYGLLMDISTNMFFLVSVDPSTGVVTKIGTGTTLLNQQSSGAAIDKIHQQFIYLYSNSIGYEIATIDIATGNIIYNVLIEPYTAKDNFYSLEYDNLRGKLYAYHWQSNPQILNLGNDTTICPGSTLMLNAGNPGSTYIWNTGDTTQTIAVSNPGKYLVTVSNGNCSIKDSINISVNFSPQVKLEKDTAICTGKSLILNAGNPGSTYIWNTGATTQTITVSNTGKYLVTVSNGNCSATGSINVSVDSPPKVNLGKDTTICPGTDLILNPHNDTVSYTWNDNSHNSTLEVNKSGKYSVTITDKYGCANSDTITISQYPVSYLNLVKDTTICNGCSITLNAGNGFKEYRWQDGSNSHTYMVKTSGTYWVNVTDQYGCKYCDTIIVREECEGKDIFVPNAFTPDKYNINDVFKVVAPTCFTNFNMKIYNRWGGLLYETNDINKGWDGKFRNENVPEGVYVYIITYYNINNSTSKLHKIGSVTLLR